MIRLKSQGMVTLSPQIHIPDTIISEICWYLIFMVQCSTFYKSQMIKMRECLVTKSAQKEFLKL